MLSEFITKQAKYALENRAKFLTLTLAILYASGTAGQAISLYTNKKIPEKEKRFLIPQEIVNGVLEVVTFLAIASRFEKWGKSLAEKGVIVGEGLAKGDAGFVKAVTVLFSLVGTILALDFVTPLIRNPLTILLQKHIFKTKIEDKEQLTRPMLPSISLNTNIKFNPNNPFRYFENTMNANQTVGKAYPATSFGSNPLRIF